MSEARASLSTPLLTHELGSLAKPDWRVKAEAGVPLDERDLQEARAGGSDSPSPGTRSSSSCWGGPLDQKPGRPR